MKNANKKAYVGCVAETLKIENEDVLTQISGIDTGINQANFSIDLDELFN